MTETKKAIEILSEVEDATAGLEDLPRVIQLLMSCYNLDEENLTKEQIINIGLAHKTIYATLSTVQMRIYDIIDKLQRIDIKRT